MFLGLVLISGRTPTRALSLCTVHINADRLMWLRCRAIPTAPLCFRKGGGGVSEWMAQLQRFFDKNIYVALITVISSAPPPSHPFLVQIFQTLDRCWGGIWPQYADTSISLSGKKFQTRNSDTAPTVSFQGVLRRSFQSLSWHLR